MGDGVGFKRGGKATVGKRSDRRRDFGDFLSFFSFLLLCFVGRTWL